MGAAAGAGKLGSSPKRALSSSGERFRSSAAALASQRAAARARRETPPVAMDSGSKLSGLNFGSSAGISPKGLPGFCLIQLFCHLSSSGGVCPSASTDTSPDPLSSVAAKRTLPRRLRPAAGTLQRWTVARDGVQTPPGSVATTRRELILIKPLIESRATSMVSDDALISTFELCVELSCLHAYGARASPRSQVLRVYRVPVLPVALLGPPLTIGGTSY
mmetsp:Transcript_13021/g.36625  ORF Transcript_13021/g.36625 Transcript_13021/m.36625 type:complete len:219 (+) Transcript_13021:2953-3609(+)